MNLAERPIGQLADCETKSSQRARQRPSQELRAESDRFGIAVNKKAKTPLGENGVFTTGSNMGPGGAAGNSKLEIESSESNNAAKRNIIVLAALR